MFADSLLDSPWATRSRRGWTTLVSFGLQAVALGSLLLVPLLYTTGLPHPQWAASLVAPAPAPAPAPPQIRNQTAVLSNISASGRIMTPQSIPRQIEQVVETGPPPALDPIGPGVPGGTGDPLARNGILNSIGTRAIEVATPAPPPHPIRVSIMMEGNLIRRVQPIYPIPAKLARVQGNVVLHALISKQGTIEHLQVIRGSPLLVGAAMEAVRQWRYRPYFLNNEPIEVETQVTVNFVLSGG